MSSILETISGDRRLELKNEEVVRRMLFGAKWRKIRIGCRVTLNGTVNIGNPQFGMGVCAGNSAFKAGTVNVSFGFMCPQFTQPFTYNAGPPAYFSTPANGCSGMSKVGASTTLSALNMSANQPMIAATSATPHMFAATITRDGSVLNLNTMMGASTAGQVQAGMSQLDFLRNMESEILVVPATNNTVYNAVSFSLTNQTELDYAFIYWSHDVPTLEISDWLVIRFA